MYFSKSFFSEEGTPIEVELICSKCGLVTNITDMSLFDKVRDEYCTANPYNPIECSCGHQNRYDLIEPKKLIAVKPINSQPTPQPNIPKCPICGSTDLSKITATKKAGKAVLFGLFAAGDMSKTWKCNKCGSKF